MLQLCFFLIFTLFSFSIHSLRSLSFSPQSGSLCKCELPQTISPSPPHSVEHQICNKMMMTLSATSSSSCYPNKLNLLTSSSSLSKSVPFSLSSTTKRAVTALRAAKQQQSGPVKKRPGRTRSQEKPPETGGGESAVEVVPAPASQTRQSHPTSPLPKPPAGFVLDPHGKVLAASSKRIATIVDSTNNLPLECVIRRVFESSQGDECMLLCPVDTPVQILKSTNFNGWSAVNDDEVEAIIPAAAFALAKIHMHFVVSGFCYTARGGFCYSEEDILEFRTDDGEDIEGLPSEGVEITCFHLDGTHYMIYTPSDPLLFVAVKDKNGVLRIADDDLLEDPAIIGAIDEETEFNALVEEEATLLESLLGER